MNHILLGYIGPGAGIEAIGALWALVVTLGAAFSVILLAPLRALIRKLRGKKKGMAGDGEGDGSGQRIVVRSV